ERVLMSPGAGRVECIHTAAAAGLPMRSHRNVRVVPGVGIAADRYALGRGHYSADARVSRDLTLVEGETLDALRAEHGLDLEPGSTRRNLTTRSVRLNDLLGRRFFIGDVLCVGTGPCNPCQYLADLTRAPLLRPMVGRGGLRADVLSDGAIAVWDL